MLQINPLLKLKSKLSNNLVNIPGVHTDRKILVIESDDWGSIRMPSKEIYKLFISRGFNMSGSNYNRLDNLESDEDLVSLFEVLNSVKDSRNNHPIVTANIIVGNPDFDKIRYSGFNEYYYELVTETLKKYPKSRQVESLWRTGERERVFHPQFHGREHVNVVRWINALKTKNPDILFTFDHNTTFSGEEDYNFMEVLDFDTPEDLVKMNQGLTEGLDIFEKIFGYKSLSFIPPCYTWNSGIEEKLFEKGVKYIQGLVVQFLPTGKFGRYRRKYHFLGNRNSFGQYYLIRNCFFEPSLSGSTDPVGECLSRINIAFRWKKPAIICSHRINYIGSLDERNRTENLQLLKELLSRILKLWPDVEFMTSDQLGGLISKEKN